jgi:hypothetical protein
VAVKLSFGPQPPKKLWVGVVSHDSGENIYVGCTREQVLDELFDFCNEWWEDEGVPVYDGVDGSIEGQINWYFEHANSESWSVHEVDLPAGLCS